MHVLLGIKSWKKLIVDEKFTFGKRKTKRWSLEKNEKHTNRNLIRKNSIVENLEISIKKSKLMIESLRKKIIKKI